MQAKAEVFVFREHLSEERAVVALADFDILCSIRERMVWSISLIARLPRLKLLTITGASLPGLDLDAAAALGILVCNARVSTADRATTEHATPELAWGLLLALARHLPSQNQAGRESGWQTRPGTVLAGKTLGLLGLGKLGRRVARYGQAFDMRVIAWSPNLTVEAAREVGVTRVDRDALFAETDALSIHMRLSDRSRGLVDADALGRMEAGAWLINTSRGPIVDQAALLAVLSERRIAGAALDVFDEEPLPDGHPLRSLPNVILTPHLGYFTAETMAAFYAGTVVSVTAYLEGAPLQPLNMPCGRRS